MIVVLFEVNNSVIVEDLKEVEAETVGVRHREDGEYNEKLQRS